MEEQKGKLGLGKIYEKYLILKRNSHTLQIACVFDETTQSQEFFVVSQVLAQYILVRQSLQVVHLIVQCSTYFHQKAHMCSAFLAGHCLSDGTVYHLDFYKSH